VIILKIGRRLSAIKRILDSGPEASGTCEVLELLGAGGLSSDILGELKLYSECLPMVEEVGYTAPQRYMHFLWDALDKLPISIIVDFSIPFRRILAKRLFASCGRNFIAEENVRFNFPQKLEVGDDVFLNRGTFLDTKGGVTLGNYVGLAEDVQIFTHKHSESDHIVRRYEKVILKDFVMVNSGAMILPGVTIGEQAIVAARALVHDDVPPNAVVGGVPAKVMRDRRTEGRSGKELNHVWLHKSAFQDEQFTGGRVSESVSENSQRRIPGTLV
jgi:acetyltransferase-like isoleucine patch superfamily enzyme